MNVLAIGAHFDDVELGCGGALAKHVKNGDKVIIFTATNSEFSNQQGRVLRKRTDAFREGKNAADILGAELIVGDRNTFCLEYEEVVNAKLVELIELRKIDLIYTHWDKDVHHDHRNLALATIHAAKHVNKILMYRSNWYLSEDTFRKEFFVDISQTWVEKEKAILAYESEMNRVGTKWVDYFKMAAKMNGLQMGVEYAEGFQVVRWIV